MAVTERTLWLLDQLRRTVGGEADDTVRALADAWVKAWDTLSEAWRAAIDDILDVHARTGRWPEPWLFNRIARLNQAGQLTQESLLALTVQAQTTTGAGIDAVVAATVAAEPAIMASQLPAGLAKQAIARYAAAVKPNAVEAIAVRCKQQVTQVLWPLSADAVEAMRKALVVGVAVGDNPRDVARDMLRRCEGNFNGGLARAVNISRTELLDAYRSTSAQVHADNADVLDGWTWLANLDRRVCPACLGMHGTHHPLEQPGPWGHQQCIPAGAEVFGPAVQASTTRWFVGQLVEIRTENGRHLSVTPNHPVLTTQGWVAAGDLHQGHDVICARPRERNGAVAGAEPDDYQQPSLIEDVAGSFDSPGLVRSVVVPTAPVDFHGDGTGSNVHVVRAHSALLDDLEAGLAEPSDHLTFLGGHMRVPGVPCDAILPGQRGGTEVIKVPRPAALGTVGGRHKLSILLGGALGRAQAVPFGHGSQSHARIGQPAVDQAPRLAERLRNCVTGLAGGVAAHDLFGIDAGVGHHGDGGLPPRQSASLSQGAEQPSLLEVLDEHGRTKAVPGRGDLGRFASEVEADRVVDVFRRDFSGHVYNLQTAGGWYAANGIITHNCRCVRMPKVKSWAELGIPGQEEPDLTPDARARFAELPEADKLAIMGPARLHLLNTGLITFDDLATLRQTPAWRPSYVPTPVAELRRLADTRRASR